MPVTVVNVAYALAPVTRATPGGAEQVLAMLDEALVTRGHHSIVVAQEGSCVAGELITVPRLDEPFTDDVQIVARQRVRECVAQVSAKADIVHFHGIDAPSVMPPLDIPAVVTVHMPIHWYPAEFLASTNITFVCVSQSQFADFPGTARLIPNGVDLTVFAPPAEFFYRNYAVSLSRICQEKNLHDGMDAAQMAGAEFFLAGNVAPYPSHEMYYREFVEPRLNEHCRFLGALSVFERRDLLASARCVLIPSTVAETSSLVAMESLACGTPVVAYRSGALPEIVRDGVTGYIVDDVNSMADAIRAIDRIDRAACRKEAEERFDARRMVESYLDLYTTIGAGVATH